MLCNPSGFPKRAVARAPLCFFFSRTFCQEREAEDGIGMEVRATSISSLWRCRPAQDDLICHQERSSERNNVIMTRWRTGQCAERAGLFPRIPLPVDPRPLRRTYNLCTYVTYWTEIHAHEPARPRMRVFLDSPLHTERRGLSLSCSSVVCARPPDHASMRTYDLSIHPSIAPSISRAA